MSANGVVANARVIGAAAIMTCKILFRSRIVAFAAVLQPIVFATIAGLILRQSGHDDFPLSAAMGVAMMGGWSSLLFFGGGLLDRERRQGTLELLIAAPTPLLAVLLGACMAAAALLLYSLVSTLAVALLVFHTHITVAHPGWLAVAMAFSILVMMAFGVMLSALFILTRAAAIFRNMMEYPVWIASGLLVPLAELPGPVRIIGSILPTTWAYQALVRAVGGSGPEGQALLYSAILGGICLVVGGFLLTVMERRARVLATLRLS